MKIINKTLLTLAILFLHSNSLTADINSELKNSNDPQLSCLIYNPDLGAVKDNKNLDIQSDEFEITKDNKLILDGSVVIDFDGGVLKAGTANIDRNKDLISFNNKGIIRLESLLFGAKKGSFNRNSQSVSLENGSMFLSDRSLLISFDMLDGDVSKNIKMSNASITSCSEPKHGWVLKAKNILLNNETKRGIAKNVSLELFNQKVLILPAIPFATSSGRMSGFLEPSLSYSSDGMDFLAPYFKVSSEKSDYTVAPRLISKRGMGLEFNARYIHGQANTLGNLDFLYLNKDKEYSKEFNSPEADRWAYAFNDTFKIGSSSNIAFEWSKASDSTVLRDVPGDIVALGNQRAENLIQSITFQSYFKNVSLAVNHLAYQSLNPLLTNGYSKSPEIDVQYHKSIDNFKFKYRVNYSKYSANKTHGFNGYQVMGKYLFLNDNPDEGSRVFAEALITNQTSFQNLSITSKVGIQNISYNLVNRDSQAKDVSVPNIHLLAKSTFYKKENGLTKILEPKLALGYVGYKDQSMNPIFDTEEISPNNQLFNNSRFSGLDRIGDQKFYTLGITYKTKKMGMDKFRFDISKKIYLKDRRVWVNPMMGQTDMSSQMMTSNSMMKSMNAEPIVLMASYMPKKNTMLMMYSGLNKKNDSILLGGANLKTSNKYGSYGYSRRYRRMAGNFNVPMDYSEVFARINLNKSLNIIAKVKRDHETDMSIESLFGLGFQNCCIGIQLTYSDKELSRYVGLNNEVDYLYLNDAWNNIIDIENKSRINLSFELKGFNSSFDKISRLFNNSLLNY